jgi:hypothetical protein
MKASRIVSVIVGVLLVLLGTGMTIAGTVIAVAATAAADGEGFLTTRDVDLRTDGAAIVVDGPDLASTPGDWTPWVDELDLRATVTADAPDGEVFVGIGRHDDVAAYLDGVTYDEVTRIDDGRRVTYRTQSGARTATPPGDETFWVATATGPGTQVLTWTAEPGTWTAVVMRPDGADGVAVTASAGARSDVLLPTGIGIGLVGLALLAVGTALVVVALPSAHQQPAAPARVPPPERVHPLRLEGRLDVPLRRWLWLVKWVLLIPHFIVLAFLWLAFVVLTIVAGFAILFTGRYPRGLFDVNVGILRWSWRVSFYGYGVLGTDRYPPFAFAPTDHPAELDVAYPERLSRGLVLVKWWLLAIPHYLVLAVLTGGAATWTYQVSADESWQVALGGGLIGLLLLVAAIALLFTGRYPAGLFDLVVGLQRWVYRVIVYAALMTDQYPPFRLDLGGGEPQGPITRPPAAGPTGQEVPPPPTPVGG